MERVTRDERAPATLKAAAAAKRASTSTKRNLPFCERAGKEVGVRVRVRK
jgi:hypothetical protein